MNDLSDLVLRVRERAAQQTEALPTCLTDQDVAAAEREVGDAQEPAPWPDAALRLAAGA
jgi:hypothetical protein